MVLQSLAYINFGDRIDLILFSLHMSVGFECLTTGRIWYCLVSGLELRILPGNRFENLKYSMYSSSWTCVNSLMATWYISAPNFWFIRFVGVFRCYQTGLQRFYCLYIFMCLFICSQTIPLFILQDFLSLHWWHGRVWDFQQCKEFI